MKKRNVLSGVQKRKRAAEEKEKIGKLPKLTLWFNTGATSAIQTILSNIASTSVSTPATSATSTVLSDIASTFKSIPATNHPVSADIPIVSLPVAAAGYIFYKRKYPNL